MSNGPFGLSGSSIAMGVVGLLLTFALLSGLRPFQGELESLNLALLSGPILLVALAASRASQPKAQPKKHSSAGAVAGFGVVLLLVGGCPWIYTPYFNNGRTDSASGMLGTIIFITIGLPGLIITAIGLINARKNRRVSHQRTLEESKQSAHTEGETQR